LPGVKGKFKRRQHSTQFVVRGGGGNHRKKGRKNLVT